MTPLDVGKLERQRELYRATNFDTRFVKIFMDGVPTAARTAAMLAPYTPTEEGGEQTSGQLHIHRKGHRLGLNRRIDHDTLKVAGTQRFALVGHP